jgi:hypothetical protein
MTATRSALGPILRWTRFDSDPHGTGPEKRTAQISELVAHAGFAVESMRPPTGFSRWRTWYSGAQARWRFGPCASVDRAGIGLLGFRYLFYRQALSRHRGARILLWETTYDTVLPSMALAAGFRVIAVPHNLESLVSEQVFANHHYDPSADLAAEVRRLSLAESVFTIAKEERWFLEARGLAPDYLPYFPDATLRRECDAIRSKRVIRSKPDGTVDGPLLLLGSAFNPATARGMATQLDWISELKDTALSVVVAGPETDALFGSRRSAGIRVLGRLSRLHLVELLESCSALLIHTSGGAGAITRIPEALLSGMPVVANPNAARDQYGTAGVSVYSTPDEFRELVIRPHSIPPPPSMPEAAATRFCNALRA